MHQGDVSAVPTTALPEPLTPSELVNAWDCSTAPDGSAPLQPLRDDAHTAVPPLSTEGSSNRPQPSSLLGGDAVINISAADSDAHAHAGAPAVRDAGGGAPAQIRSPRAVAGDTRWSVKWVNSWTGDTSPRSPIASPRNVPAPAGPSATAGAAGNAASGSTLTLVEEVSEEVGAVSQHEEAAVVGVGRRGLVDVGDGGDGTVMWSRSVPRTPTSRASDGHASSAAALAADNSADGEDVDIGEVWLFCQGTPLTITPHLKRLFAYTLRQSPRRYCIVWKRQSVGFGLAMVHSARLHVVDPKLARAHASGAAQKCCSSLSAVT